MDDVPPALKSPQAKPERPYTMTSKFRLNAPVVNSLLILLPASTSSPMAQKSWQLTSEMKQIMSTPEMQQRISNRA
jgi:hypothetical protein